MSQHTLKRLKTLTDEQLHQICDLNEKAFTNEPMIESMLGGDLSRSYLYWSSILRAAILEGELWVVTVDNEGKEELASCAVWYAPGKGLFATEAQRALGYDDYVKGCSPETRKWLEETLYQYPSYMKEFVGRLFTPEETQRYWWCYILATHPSHQRKGYGAALVDIGFQKACKSRESGSFAGLAASNSSNVPIYQNMGFKIQGSTDVPSSIDGIPIHVDAFTKRP